MGLTKPPVLAIWGNTNTTSADMVQPGVDLFASGFLPPPAVGYREHVNWLLNMLHNAVRYQSARGVPDWDATETQYVVGSVVFESGFAWILNTGPASATAPHLDLTHWGRLVPVQPGTFLRRSILTSGTTLASVANCRRAVIGVLGGGGGGAGALGLGGGTSIGGGGGAAGSYGEFETTTIPVTWNYTIGAGGAGGAAPATLFGAILTSLGGNGGASTISDGVSIFTAPGGLGAPSSDGGDSGAAPSIVQVSNGSSVLALIGVQGEPGDVGTCFGAVGLGAGVPTSGRGGSSRFGSGGRGHTGSNIGDTVPSAGTPALGNGAGGGGSANNSPGGLTGGNGTAGLIFLEEYA